MLKIASVAAAALSFAYYACSIGYSALLIGVGVPAYNRCETTALKMVEKMEADPNALGSASIEGAQVCQQSAKTLEALLPLGIKN